MGKCKNIECNNKTLGKRIYCSLTCRNVYVNKHLRDYKKNSVGLSKKDEYLKTPKKCGNCGEVLSYEKRHNTYCGNSCSAIIKNKTRVLPSKYNMSKEGVDSIKKANQDRYKHLREEYLMKPKKCKNCEQELSYKKRENVFCDMTCKKEYHQENIEKYRRYQLDCRFDFNLADYNEEFNFGLIEEHGWYTPSNSNNPNTKGVSRDHIFSVRRGFELGISSEIIKHPANCRLMIHSENIGKGKNCDIGIEELKEKIKEWDKKYGYATSVVN